MKVYIGIDWSEQKHDICYMHENGEVLRSLQISHNMEGFYALDKAREELGISFQECMVGLETAHSLLVDYLWDQGYTQIVVLPPQVVKSNQGRYRQSGARDDRWDARLIADILRTDHKHYAVWQPDSLLTRQIRSTVRMVYHLNREIVRNSNRLRAVLLRYYPAALNLFTRLSAPLTLAFIQTYPTPQAATALSYTEFTDFVRKHHHTQPRKWMHSYNTLQQPYPPTSSDIVAVYAPQAISLAKILTVFIECKETWIKELTRLYESHPDRHIFESLPAAGTFLEPALLAKLGDDRQRFPTARILQAVAGTCPITKRSGKRKSIRFRRACDREFRSIVQQWAKLTLDVSPWADAYYRSILPSCDNTNDAVRRLANRWLEILWRLWQDRVPYDQSYHLKQHTLRCKPR
jgi:transposase